MLSAARPFPSRPWLVAGLLAAVVGAPGDSHFPNNPRLSFNECATLREAPGEAPRR